MNKKGIADSSVVWYIYYIYRANLFFWEYPSFRSWRRHYHGALAGYSQISVSHSVTKINWLHTSRAGQEVQTKKQLVDETKKAMAHQAAKSNVCMWPNS